ncbi:MAG: hypothetical protein FWE04_07655, partial [Oscillospiraceae bacterium]|nr:hypothetical protein [Oscillospiraceae bacterium]
MSPQDAFGQVFGAQKLAGLRLNHRNFDFANGSSLQMAVDSCKKRKNLTPLHFSATACEHSRKRSLK